MQQDASLSFSCIKQTVRISLVTDWLRKGTKRTVDFNSGEQELEQKGEERLKEEADQRLGDSNQNQQGDQQR